MTPKKVLVTIFAILLAAPSFVCAETGVRSEQGHILGFGVGFGLVDQVFSDSEVVLDNSSTEFGLAANFRLGGVASEQLWVYFQSQQVVYRRETNCLTNPYARSDDDFVPEIASVETVYVQGISGLGISYFLAPQIPSIYFTGLFGMGYVLRHIGGSGDYGNFGFDLNMGLQGGIGYEFSHGKTVELQSMYAGFSDAEPGGIDDDMYVFNLTLSFNWMRY